MIHNVSRYNILATSSIARRTYHDFNRKAPRTHGDESNQGCFKFGFRISMLRCQSQGMFWLGCEKETSLWCRMKTHTDVRLRARATLTIQLQCGSQANAFRCGLIFALGFEVSRYVRLPNKVLVLPQRAVTPLGDNSVFTSPRQVSAWALMHHEGLAVLVSAYYR